MAVACAVGVYALVMGLTGSPQQGALAGARPASRPTATKVFSRLPQRCALLSSAVVMEYLPGTTCNSQAYENPGGTDSRALWTTPASSANGDYFTDDVEVLLEQPSLINTEFNSAKSLDTVPSRYQVTHDSRPVAGLGTEAYIVYGASRESSKTFLEVEVENALISIDLDATVHGQGVPQAQAEQAALAMARDIIKKLH